MGPRPLRKPAASTVDDTIIPVAVTLANHEARILVLEEINGTINKIWKTLKRWGPIVATAAISSGVVSGRWGAFFHALFSGTP